MLEMTIENPLYNELSQKVQLFKGITPEQLHDMLRCLGAKKVYYKKNEIIVMADDRLESIGLVLSGSVLVTTEDFMGIRSILTVAQKFDIFAETFVCANITKSPVTITAAENSEIMWLKFPGILATCDKACGYHTTLIENMVSQLAEKNIVMHQKLEILSKRTLRDRVLAYLHLYAHNDKSKIVTIPLSRSELADFLNADRASLSRELGKMKSEGILDYSMNTFRILH